MNKALLEKAAQCKSAEEVKALAAEAGMDISDEQAVELFAKVNGATPLTDEELETVAGGCGDDDIIECDQCGISFRKGDAVEGIGCHDQLGSEHYTRFLFCCSTCLQTYKNNHPEYRW